MKLTSAFEKGSLLGERVWIVDTLFRIIHFKCCAKMCTSHKHFPFVLTEFGLFRISCRTHIFVCSSLWRVICLLNNKIVVSVSTAPVAVALNYFWITNGVILPGNVLDQEHILTQYKHPASLVTAVAWTLPGWCPSIVPSLTCGDPVPLDDGQTLLLQAASQGNVTLLSMLLNQDPLLDIHHHQHDLTSALISAALNGHTGTCWQISISVHEII